MKTILITGSTDGIGKLAALKLGKEQHKILLHGRNSVKLENSIADVKTTSNNENISGYLADLSSFDSIRGMVESISSQVEKIDVLINNAGVFKSVESANEAGLDLRFMVNYFAPFVLTQGLITQLQNSEAPRVLNLSSAAQASVSLEALKGDRNLSDQVAYAQSKLALTMWSFFFAKEHPRITTIAVNPGSLLNTKMVQEAYGRFWSSADKGADILYELADLEKYKSYSGTYFDNDAGDFSKAHPDAYSAEKLSELIFVTKKIVNA